MSSRREPSVARSTSQSGRFRRVWTNLPASKSAEIVTICPSEFRSAMMTMALSVLGYTNVKTMTLGMREWNSRGYPTIKAP
jgi:rhodanese-related sulfurtransferase